jgi:hypothetical protein
MKELLTLMNHYVQSSSSRFWKRLPSKAADRLLTLKMTMAMMTLARMIANPTIRQYTFCSSSKNSGIVSSDRGIVVVRAAMIEKTKEKRRH